MKLYFCVVKQIPLNEADAKQPGCGKYVSRSQTLYEYKQEFFTKKIGFTDRRACEVEVSRCKRKLKGIFHSQNAFNISIELIKI